MATYTPTYTEETPSARATTGAITGKVSKAIDTMAWMASVTASSNQLFFKISLSQRFDGHPGGNTPGQHVRCQPYHAGSLQHDRDGTAHPAWGARYHRGRRCQRLRSRKQRARETD